MSSEIYPGTPLRNDEIRLVYLLPGQWSDPIRCELRQTSLSQQPKYHALSYVWGSRRATRPIWLNGRIFAATVNLESALRHLRLRYEEGLVIWIDALSINQDDIQERTHQVELMGHIYQACAEVVVYLGDEPVSGRRRRGTSRTVRFEGDDRDLPLYNGFLIPKATPEKNKRCKSNEELTTLDVFAFVRALGTNEHLYRFTHLRLWDSPEYQESQMALIEALRRLMNPPYTPWWKRIWVVQEVTMPKNVTLVCGSVSAPWKMFAEAASKLARHSRTCCAEHATSFPRDLWRVLIDFSNQVRDIHELRRSHLKSHNLQSTEVGRKDMSLLNLLQRFRNRRASDPRDKVYALLSLARPEQGMQYIAPNYSLSEKEVFTSATIAIIFDTQSLAVLSTDTGRKFRSDLPSWVPDWDAPGAQSNDVRAEAIHLYSVKGSRGFKGMNLQQLLLGSVLEVDAAPRSMVSRVEEVMWGDSAKVSRETINKWWIAVEKVPALASMLVQFWKLLCADIFCEQSVVGSKFSLRRIIPNDEITFVSWAIESPRSPFNLQLFPNDRDEDDVKEDWKSNSYYDRAADTSLDRMTSAAARLWKSLLYLNMNTPSMGTLLTDLLWKDSGTEQILQGLMPLGETRKTILRKLMAEYGLFWGDHMVDAVSGDIREDAPWKEFFQEVEHKLAEKFGEERLRNGTGTVRRRRIAAMDSSIMAATLSRRLFFTADGNVGLAPADTRPGDGVFYIAGGKTPFILRSSNDGRAKHYEVVGDCYLLGMNDEAPPDLRYRTVCLV